MWSREVEIPTHNSPESAASRLSESVRSGRGFKKRLIGRVRGNTFKLSVFSPLWTAGVGPVIEGAVLSAEDGAAIRARIRPDRVLIGILLTFGAAVLAVAVVLILTNGWVGTAAVLVAGHLAVSAGMLLPYKRRAADAERLLRLAVNGAS